MIIVDGSGVQYSSDSIGNTDRAISYKTAYVEQYHQFLARSGMSIHCLAEGDDAAEELAFEVAMFVTSLRSIASDLLQFQEVSMPTQSKPSPIKKENWNACYDSVVSFSYAFAIRRKNTPIDKGLLLTEINTYVHQEGASPALPEANPGDTGGTNTGGQNGNHGGTGGTNGDGDCVDDGLININITVTNKDVTVEESQV